MQYCFKKANSDKLIVFFSGWGCDENQFENLKDKDDVLILYDYQNLNLDFDFDKYKEINLLAYSAGVFISSIMQDKIPHLKKKVAINGNPYLFDKKLGIPASIIKVFKEITLDNYLDFRREYMVETEEDYQRYNQLQSLRTIESCEAELISLQKLYEKYKNNIKPDFDFAVMSDNDKIFNLQQQKEYYKNKVIVIPHTRHHVFFCFNSFAEILSLEHE